MGKQTRSSFKSKGMISTSRPLELLYFDLFRSISPSSLGGKSYAFVFVDDYSRFTWTLCNIRVLEPDYCLLITIKNVIISVN